MDHQAGKHSQVQAELATLHKSNRINEGNWKYSPDGTAPPDRCYNESSMALWQPLLDQITKSLVLKLNQTYFDVTSPDVFSQSVKNSLLGRT